MEHSNDMALAFDIHNRLNNKFGVTENAIIPENVKEREYQPRTLIDNTLELIDPTPNIHTLFVQFNGRYFWNKLLPVEVKWSNRMTTCAGVCSFHPRNQQCIITLSAPLLKLRPRKDLVETLLHEMIHGYLFLTNNNRDRDGHGPEFHKHMYRINKEAGTHITVYHNFHDEVRLYQQHWWCCNGPCQKKAPYFGTVRRAMNRPPGPNDNWWKMHQQTCGGQFVKIREPEKQPAKNKKVPKENRKNLPNIPKSKDISDWLTKTTDKSKDSKDKISGIKIPPKTSVASPSNPSIPKSNPTKNIPSTFTKLGNTSNNIHGWGVGGPNTSNSNSNSNSTPSSSQGITKTPKFHAAGVLGGSGSGKSNLLDKFTVPKISGINKAIKKPGLLNGAKSFAKNGVVDLIETPNKRKSNDNLNMINWKVPKTEKEVKNPPQNANCPVCNKIVKISELNDHLDVCLVAESNVNENESTPKTSKSSNKNDNNHYSKDIEYSPIVISDSSGSEEFQTPIAKERRQKCLVCNDFIDPNVTLNDHLEDCIGSVFSDDSFPEFVENDPNVTEEGDKISENNFPCPVCMAFIEEPLMNDHLFICLNKDILEK